MNNITAKYWNDKETGRHVGVISLCGNDTCSYISNYPRKMELIGKSGKITSGLKKLGEDETIIKWFKGKVSGTKRVSLFRDDLSPLYTQYVLAYGKLPDIKSDIHNPTNKGGVEDIIKAEERKTGPTYKIINGNPSNYFACFRGEKASNKKREFKEFRNSNSLDGKIPLSDDVMSNLVVIYDYNAEEGIFSYKSNGKDGVSQGCFYLEEGSSILDGEKTYLMLSANQTVKKMALEYLKERGAVQTFGLKELRSIGKRKKKKMNKKIAKNKQKLS